MATPCASGQPVPSLPSILTLADMTTPTDGALAARLDRMTWPEAAAWFRRDPRVKEIIADEGYLGLGLEEDDKYAKENF